jgi:hypothetical protein
MLGVIREPALRYSVVLAEGVQARVCAAVVCILIGSGSGFESRDAEISLGLPPSVQNSPWHNGLSPDLYGARSSFVRA